MRIFSFRLIWRRLFPLVKSFLLFQKLSDKSFTLVVLSRPASIASTLTWQQPARVNKLQTAGCGWARLSWLFTSVGLCGPTYPGLNYHTYNFSYLQVMRKLNYLLIIHICVRVLHPNVYLSVKNIFKKNFFLSKVFIVRQITIVEAAIFS